MRRRTAALLLLLWAELLAAADVEFPLLQAFAWFPYGENGTPAPGRVGLDLRLSHSNLFSYHRDHGYFHDMELTSAVAAVRVGLSRRLAAELYLNARRSGGGFLDRGIERFHQLFGMPGAGRPLFPRNAFRYLYAGAFDLSSGRLAALPPVVALLAELTRTPRLWLRGRVAVGVPLAAVPGYAAGRAFLQAGVLGGWQEGPWRAEYSQYVALVGRPAWLGPERIRRLAWLGEARLGWRGVRAGFLWRTSTLTRHEMAHPALLVSLGCLVHRRLEIGVTEDLPPFDTSPDIGFYLRLRLGD